MSNLSDLIEQHLLQLLIQSSRVELQRRELARMFRCVPSQINYVLETRFNPERGYVVESRRGGGGYIRIYRLQQGISRHVEGFVPDSVSREKAEALLGQFIVAQRIQEEQAVWVRIILERNVAGVPVDLEDIVRAKMLRAILLMMESMG